MKINGKTYTLAKTTLADIKALAPMKYVEGWAPDDGEDLIECETDEAIDKMPQLNEFLRQGLSEKTSFQETIERMIQIVNA